MSTANGQRPLCQCGCGTETGFSPRDRTNLGLRRGDPIPFKPGHRARVKPPRLEGRYRIADNGCWEWLGKKNLEGYGRIHVHGRALQAHRVYYEHHVGPIPDGLHLDHLCRNHGCVNPAHLEPVTPALNTQRGNLAKLTLAQVIYVKRHPEAHAPSLAAEWGVRKDAIYRIRNGETWRGVGDDASEAPA